MQRLFEGPFEYIGLELTSVSKPFKTKERAEQERLKYSEKNRKRIGLGVVRAQM
jgi:hypothetical protein